MNGAHPQHGAFIPYALLPLPDEITELLRFQDCCSRGAALDLVVTLGRESHLLTRSIHLNGRGPPEDAVEDGVDERLRMPENRAGDEVPRG